MYKKGTLPIIKVLFEFMTSYPVREDINLNPSDRSFSIC